MNKADLVDAVARQLSSSKAEAERALEAVLTAITSGLRADDRVTLHRFGTFKKKHRAARKGINPATGQPIPIRASNTCGFKPSEHLREAI